MAELPITRQENPRVVPSAGEGWHPLHRISEFFKRHYPFKGREKAELSSEKQEPLQNHAEFPAEVEVKENSRSYVFSVDLPGFQEKDVEVLLYGGYLVIQGHRESERDEKTDTYYCSERSFGSFSRSFLLPAQANPEAISATLKDGVLTVEVKKNAS